jgi:hypothetical protein
MNIMLKKKYIGVALACALALGASGAAFATTVSVGGVKWDPNSTFDLTVATSSLIETSVASPGDTLTGYGLVSGINQDTNFCSGCQLAYTFQYTVANTDPSTLQVLFNAGAVNFYVLPSGTYNSKDPSNITTGTPWLTLTGHNSTITGYPTGWQGDLFATASGSITTPGTGSGGAGYLDATGGPAAIFMQTQTQHDGLGGLADFFMTTNFSAIPGGSFVGGNGVTYAIEGGATITGSTMPVPEPAEIGLLGLGLGVLGLMLRRRSKEEAEELS